MMQGRVNQNCEAILPIVIKNNTITQRVNAVIDTGFSGFLTLPSDIISILQLSWEGRDIATHIPQLRAEKKIVHLYYFFLRRFIVDFNNFIKNPV